MFAHPSICNSLNNRLIPQTPNIKNPIKINSFIVSEKDNPNSPKSPDKIMSGRFHINKVSLEEVHACGNENCCKKVSLYARRRSLATGSEVKKNRPNNKIRKTVIINPFFFTF